MRPHLDLRAVLHCRHGVEVHLRFERLGRQLDGSAMTTGQHRRLFPAVLGAAGMENGQKWLRWLLLTPQTQLVVVLRVLAFLGDVNWSGCGGARTAAAQSCPERTHIYCGDMLRMHRLIAVS